jgi:hypothetical protein
MSHSPSRSRFIAACLLLLAGVVLLYGPSVGHDFIEYDDNLNVFDNPDQGLSTGTPHWAVIWREPFLEMYIPLTYTAWAALAQVSEGSHTDATGLTTPLEPAPFHAANVALHALNTALVFYLIYLCIGQWAPAAAGAALFAAHPVQVEPVAWVTGMKDLLCAFFLILCMIAALRWRRRRSSVFAYLACLAFAAAAILSKTTAVMAPLLALAVLIWDGRLAGRRLASLLVPMTLLSAAIMAAFPNLQAKPFSWHPSFGQKIVVALDALGFYASKLVWPFGLMLSYDRTPERLFFGHAWTDGYFLAGVAVVALTGYVVVRLRRGPSLALMSLATICPVLGFFYFTNQLNTTVADRYLYVSLIGLGLATAAWLAASSFRLKWPLAAVACALLALRSHDQLAHWRDTVTLFEHSGQWHHDNYVVELVMGHAYERTHQPEKRLATFEHRLAISPRDAMARNELIRDHQRSGRTSEAFLLLAEAFATRKRSFERHRREAVGDALVRLTGVAGPEEAKAALRDLRADAGARARYRAAFLAIQAEDWDSARAALEEAVEAEALLSCAAAALAPLAPELTFARAATDDRCPPSGGLARQDPAEPRGLLK